MRFRKQNQEDRNLSYSLPTRTLRQCPSDTTSREVSKYLRYVCVKPYKVHLTLVGWVCYRESSRGCSENCQLGVNTGCLTVPSKSLRWLNSTVSLVVSYDNKGVNRYLVLVSPLHRQ